MSPEIELLAQQLAEIAARTTATEVADRIRAKRVAKKDAETIRELEEIVNELISDKSELIRIAHAFEENLAAQRLSDSDVKYLTDNLFPIVTELIEQSAEGAQSDQPQAVLDAVTKASISKATPGILLGWLSETVVPCPTEPWPRSERGRSSR